MSDGIVTNGTTLRVGDGASPEVFTAVAEVVSVGQPSPETPEIDFTHLASSGREFKPGLRDFGESAMTITVVVGNALQQQLEDDVAAGTIRNYRIVYPDGVNGLGGAAYVKSFKRNDIEVDSALRAVVALRATGAWARL